MEPSTIYLEAHPKMVEKRLQNISCSEDVFDKAKPLYEEALRRSGFKPTLTYDTGNSMPKKKKRRNPTVNRLLQYTIKRVITMQSRICPLIS